MVGVANFIRGEWEVSLRLNKSQQGEVEWGWDYREKESLITYGAEET